ncbi:hypothetical protein [Sinomonas mesophila]|uniref:hypothetical protein n=1 Tax=Sinomonas mesophila TaxID=1531955 RepID=UPI00098457AE|nr:hypothetical protein [Sinomonas mesophila]
MRFHLIDRVTEIDPGRGLRARKLTSHAEPYWRSARMPVPLIVESFCQAAAWLIYAGSGGRERGLVLQFGHIEAHGPVLAGDVVDIAVDVVSATDTSMVVRGTASVDGVIVVTLEDIMCAITEAGGLEDTRSTSDRQATVFAGTVVADTASAGAAA